MSVRKYLFWMCDKGIKTYKVTDNGTFELMKPLGKDIYEDTDITKFFTWFHKSAAITKDELIDFCFLSEKEIESELLLNYKTTTKSSWDKKEIGIFCDKYVNTKNYEIFYDKDKSFVYQTGNIFNKSDVKKLYMRCIPEFSIETEEKIDMGNEETSLVNRYFINKLKELGDE